MIIGVEVHQFERASCSDINIKLQVIALHNILHINAHTYMHKQKS